MSDRFALKAQLDLKGIAYPLDVTTPELVALMPESQTISAEDIGPEIKKVAQDLANAANLDGTDESIWRQFVEQARTLVRANRFV